jgi:hypothetical protein
MADVLRFLDTARIRKPAKSEKFLIELRRERLNPLPQFLRNKRLQDLRESVSRTICLITRGFIDQRDNSNPRKPAN